MRHFFSASMLSAAVLAGLWPGHAAAQVNVEVAPRVDAQVVPRVDAQVAPRVDAQIAPRVDTQIAPNVDVQVAPRIDAQIAPQAGAAVVQDQWRFKQHNGTWWYWMPENYWMVYRSGAWTRYETAAPAAVLPAPAVTTPAPVVTTPAPVVVNPSPVVTPPLRFTPLRPGVGAVVRPRFRW